MTRRSSSPWVDVIDQSQPWDDAIDWIMETAFWRDEGIWIDYAAYWHDYPRPLWSDVPSNAGQWDKLEPPPPSAWVDAPVTNEDWSDS